MAIRGKTAVLITVVIRIAYIMHRVLRKFSVALNLQFGWCSQLNTSEMFWIDISRWMISEYMLMDKRSS